jgi:hypothetical protein
MPVFGMLKQMIAYIYMPLSFKAFKNGSVSGDQRDSFGVFSTTTPSASV